MGIWLAGLYFECTCASLLVDDWGRVKEQDVAVGTCRRITKLTEVFLTALSKYG